MSQIHETRLAEKHPTPGETAYQTVLRWIEEKELEEAGINEDWEKGDNCEADTSA